MPKRTKPITSIHQVRISLKNISPPVWRRIQVPSDITLVRLHHILQIVMPWQDCHLHQFVLPDVTYAIPDPEDDHFDFHPKDERRAKLGKVLPEIGNGMVYEYDFGDGWAHKIVVEKVQPPQEGVRYPRCISGRRACPPEDCGGPYGYPEFVAAIQDPRHPDHGDMLAWIGGGFDPEEFDLEETNLALAME
jgi:hypothetical protein